MTAPVVVTRDGDKLVIACPYEALALIRAVPIRHWDADRKLWLVPVTALAAVRKAFASWPHGLLVDLDDDPPADWAGAMFAALPPRLHKKVHRSLSATLHPDAGGDHRAMQALNSAYAEREKKSA